jgi:hypothetical protein
MIVSSDTLAIQVLVGSPHLTECKIFDLSSSSYCLFRKDSKVSAYTETSKDLRIFHFWILILDSRLSTLTTKITLIQTAKCISIEVALSEYKHGFSCGRPRPWWRLRLFVAS